MKFPPIPLCVVLGFFQLCLLSYLFVLVIFQGTLMMGFLYFIAIITVLAAAGLYQVVIPRLPLEVSRPIFIIEGSTKIPIIAHRGGGYDAPENTLAAFREAKKNGADAIEFDVAFTKDNIAVVFHDDDVDRTTNGTGRLDELTFEQVRLLDASTNHPYHSKYLNEKVPTFEEAIEECLKLEMKMVFDVKDYDSKAVTVILEMFKKYSSLYKNVIVASFYPSLIYQVRQADSNIVTALTWRPHFFSYNDISKERPKYNSGWQMTLAQTVDIVYEWALHSWIWYVTGVSGVLIHKDCISQEYARVWQLRGVHLMAWTVNEPAEKEFLRKILQVPYITDTLR